MANQTLWLIVIAVLIAAVALWWLFGRNSGNADNGAPDISVTPVTPAAKPIEAVKPVEKVATAPAPQVTETKVEKAATPPPAEQAPAPSATPTPPLPAPPAQVSQPAPEPVAKPKVPKPTPAKPSTTKSKPTPAPKSAPKAAASKALTAIGVPAAAGDADNLLQLKGVGPKLHSLLGTLGISRFDQIAAWTASDIEKVDAHLGNFKGRITRDAWVEQAGLLARDDIAGFEAKFGKLDGAKA